MAALAIGFTLSVEFLKIRTHLRCLCNNHLKRRAHESAPQLTEVTYAASNGISVEKRKKIVDRGVDG